MTIYFILLFKRYHFTFFASFKRLFQIIANSAIAVIPCFLLRNFVVFGYNSRITCLCILFAFGVPMAFIYYYVSNKSKLFEKIFEIKDASLKNIIKKFKI